MSEFTKMWFADHSNREWCHHILNFCDGDEQQALSKFFEIYDEFEQIRMNRCWKAALTEDNIEYNNCMEHGYAVIENEKVPIFSNPIAVYIIEMTIPAFILAVETSDETIIEKQFFTAIEDAKGNGFPLGAEHYFGKIQNWKEIFDINISFTNSR